MTEKRRPAQELIETLQVREKELNCLYRIEELTSKPGIKLEDIFEGVLQIIPLAWQHPFICHVRIKYEDTIYESPLIKETPWFVSTNLRVGNGVVGSLTVFYVIEMVPGGSHAPMQEEQRLINTVAVLLGHAIHHARIARRYQIEEDIRPKKKEWEIVLELLQRTDSVMYGSIAQKMLNHLCWTGNEDAVKLLESINKSRRSLAESVYGEENRPMERHFLEDPAKRGPQIFQIAVKALGDDEVLNLLQKWIKEEKSSFLATTLVDLDSTLAQIADAVHRYMQASPGAVELSPAQRKSVRVSLIRRFFSEQLQFISIAKEYAELTEFHKLLQHMIFSNRSRGKLGGKSAGIFLASQILKKSGKDLMAGIKTPRTWYVASDTQLEFIAHNNLEEIIEQKYKDLEQVRLEYPFILQVFKNSQFPPDLARALYIALDDFGTNPLIVRSSSLLEDRLGAAFAGKYKSVFLANQGTKAERLSALTDAIAEVYASNFHPDPIEYRIERGLVDFHEEMGVMIQEVVGTRVGGYFLPSFAGVAFSNNEFRWSPRISRQDGLIRLVMGLGTRAVDRIGADFPVLIAPGQPGLRVNVSPEEILRYSLKSIDVINFAANDFQTIDLMDLLRKHGDEIPLINKMVSIYDRYHIRKPTGLGIDFVKDYPVVTFEGLVADTPFVLRIKTMLDILQDKLQSPVDIEFASDGRDLYLLQCRPQTTGAEDQNVVIPQDIPHDEIVFTANRFVSNGTQLHISYIVYVDADRYTTLDSLEAMKAVGRAVSRLNKMLPKKQFILMGPGRWGSRGDIKLGVSVTYSDINNTAVLIEIARKKGNYMPDLSFGTHFFQDLVEAGIRYLPLYPDEEEIVFNETFLRNSPNLLTEMLPDMAELADTVRLINITEATGGKILRLIMNADDDRAVAYLTSTEPALEKAASRTQAAHRMDVGLPVSAHVEDHWHWRLHFAEKIAASISPAKHGVAAMYLFGSAKNASAGPKSDIDLLIHFRGTEEQKVILLEWLDGWSICLSELNFLRCGVTTNGLLDIQFVSDDDIAARRGFAARIDAASDAARPLKLKER